MKKYNIFLVTLVLGILNIYAQTVSIDDVTLKAGETKVVSINLTNTQTNIVSFQMDMTLPDGITLDKTGCALGSRITDADQELLIGKQPDGSFRLTSISYALNPIKGTTGEIVRFSLTAANDSKGGTASLKNIRLATSNSQKLTPDDITFKAGVSYTLTYKVDGVVYKEIPVEYGTAITSEIAPPKEGYSFSGWNNIPATMPNCNVEVTGNFSINSYTLTYIVDGEVYKTSTVVYGTVITPEAAPSKEHYIFSGWSEIPETMPAHDVIIMGSFSINSYKLTYIVDGNEYKFYIVEYGTIIIPEAAPTKEGYTFYEWIGLPKTMPNHDLEVSALFYMFGDVNTNEDVDVVDVVDIARFVVAKPSVKFREKLADLNRDNTVNIADAVTLVNYIAGDQNYVRAKTPSNLSYNYDQCQLQLLSAGQNALSLYLDGEADFTAFQFDVDVPEGTDISAIRFNGIRKDGHQLYYNKVSENSYRVTALSLSNAIFKGNMGELLQFSINGQVADDICVHDIHFVTKNGTGIAFDVLYVSGAETGVTNVNANENNDAIYDLQGRKLSKVQHGVNIVNGKIVVVK